MCAAGDNEVGGSSVIPVTYGKSLLLSSIPLQGDARYTRVNTGVKHLHKQVVVENSPL